MVVGGILITIWTWSERRTEAGAGVATIEAIPILGDIVRIGEDVHEIRKESREIKNINDEIGAIERQRDLVIDKAAQRTAIRAYASIASQIKVEYPGGINYEAIREALRLYMDRIKTVWRLNSVLDPKELYEMEKRAYRELQEALEHAANPKRPRQGPLT